MYKVILNQKALLEWRNETRYELSLWKSIEASEQLEKMICQLDKWYGESRDLERDLGGYAIVLWGDRKDIEHEYDCILQYHHLQQDEFELEDKFVSDKCMIRFRLYLCSSDYSIIIVIIDTELLTQI